MTRPSQILCLNLTRALRRLVPPPAYFSNPKTIPHPYQVEDIKLNQHEDSKLQITPTTPTQNSYPHQQEGHFREIASLLAMVVLSYIAMDNYTERMKLEKLHNQTTAINLKALQIQQVAHNNDRKNRDLQMLQERKDNAKRTFKMSLHIALLRKQLIEAGIDPINLDEAIREFEKSVKADNSSKNITDQYLWLDDASELKKYLPDPCEYDKIRKSE